MLIRYSCLKSKVLLQDSYSARNPRGIFILREDRKTKSHLFMQFLEKCLWKPHRKYNTVFQKQETQQRRWDDCSCLEMLKRCYIRWVVFDKEVYSREDYATFLPLMSLWVTLHALSFTVIVTCVSGQYTLWFTASSCSCCSEQLFKRGNWGSIFFRKQLDKDALFHLHVLCISSSKNNSCVILCVPFCHIWYVSGIYYVKVNLVAEKQSASCGVALLDYARDYTAASYSHQLTWVRHPSLSWLSFFSLKSSAGYMTSQDVENFVSCCQTTKFTFDLHRPELLCTFIAIESIDLKVINCLRNDVKETPSRLVTCLS